MFTPLSNLLQAIQCSIATKHKCVFTADEISEFACHAKGSLLTVTVVSNCLKCR